MGIFSKIGRTLFGGKGKTTGQSTVDATKSEQVAPWAAAQPSLMKLIGDLDALYGPGGAPAISGMEQQGLDAVTAAAGTPGAIGPAVAANNDVISGKYLSPDTNPYLAEIAKRVGAGANAAINATFGGRGRTGSGAHQQHAAQGTGQALNELYYTNFSNERARQDAAIGRAPQLEAGRFLPAQALLEAGQSVSARPFDIAAQRASILSNIARLGQQSEGQGHTQTFQKGTTLGEKSGVIMDKIGKLFT